MDDEFTPAHRPPKAMENARDDGAFDASIWSGADPDANFIKLEREEPWSGSSTDEPILDGIQACDPAYCSSDLPCFSPELAGLVRAGSDEWDILTCTSSSETLDGSSLPSSVSSSARTSPVMLPEEPNEFLSCLDACDKEGQETLPEAPETPPHDRNRSRPECWGIALPNAAPINKGRRARKGKQAKVRAPRMKVSSCGTRRVNRPEHNHNKEVTAILKSWYQAHQSAPWPTDDEKKDLSERSGLTIRQVSTWFINQRKRKLKPILQAQGLPLLKPKVTPGDGAYLAKAEA